MARRPIRPRCRSSPNHRTRFLAPRPRCLKRFRRSPEWDPPLPEPDAPLPVFDDPPDPVVGEPPLPEFADPAGPVMLP